MTLNHLDRFAPCQTFFSHYFISFLHTVVIYVVIVVIVSWISEGTPHAAIFCVGNRAVYCERCFVQNQFNHVQPLTRLFLAPVGEDTVAAPFLSHQAW